MNVGLMGWMGRHYGARKTAAWFGLMLAVVVGLSYGIERPLYPTDIEPADHTHAFDTYCQPFAAGTFSSAAYPGEILRRIKLETQLHEWAGAGLIATLWLIGLTLHRLDRRWVIEEWINRPPAKPETAPAGPWDIVVPGPVLGFVGLLGIIAASIVGCFAYYPNEKETLEELNLAKTEVLQGALSGDRAHALHWIPICENWNRRLQVGSYLRRWELSDYRRMKARVFRDDLELLEHLLEDEHGGRDEIRRHIHETSNSYRRLAESFRPVR
jgi:hypothetical protein